VAFSLSSLERSNSVSTPASTAQGRWSDTTCLICGAATGHLPTCAASNPDATNHLTETLPDGTTRTWTVAGIRYTATEARRQAITALMPTMTWVHTIDQPSLPFSTGALVNEIVPQLGIGRRLARIGYHPLATLRVPDCGCTDLWRCRCDVDDHPHAHAHPDLWADYPLLALVLRWSHGWGHLWLLDIGTGAVVIADDYITAPIPAGATKACAMGWCHRCPGSIRPAPGQTHRPPCGCSCHTQPPSGSNSGDREKGTTGES